MTNRYWMLNASAIRHARDCIALIKKDFGETLKLSQPDFLEQVRMRAEQGVSRGLIRAYTQLKADAERAQADAVETRSSGSRSA